MGKTVCFFTEDSGKFLLFFYFLLVKDSPEFVQGIACISAQSGVVLIRGFAHINIARYAAVPGQKKVFWIEAVSIGYSLRLQECRRYILLQLISNRKKIFEFFIITKDRHRVCFFRLEQKVL